MGVVDMDHSIFVQIQQRMALLFQFPQDQLSAGRDHEILLIEPQQTAGLVAVIGIQKGGQVTGDICFIKSDTVRGSV